ncbi:alpha/beta hydrolase [Nonomuraea terrae]|nr:alpha/beta hydrolase [Nonomuraea terrae]
MSVPLDYAQPEADQIQISLIRLPATGKKIGSIVLNFGGPGASGVESLKDSNGTVSPAVREHFDVVSFDPRGVGGSSPVHCMGTLGLDAYLSIDPTPDTPREEKQSERWDSTFAKNCLERSGKKLLAHVGTVDAARDMDVMRATLGDAGLTYLGFSYGTYLGSLYADMYPKRVRAMVLDGAEDPSLDMDAFTEDQDRGFQIATESFLRDCFKSADCPFRTRSVKGALDELDKLYMRADDAPLRNTRDARQVNEAVVRAAVDFSMYQTSSWPHLRQALTDAFKGDGTKLLRLADVGNGRRSDGTYDNDFEALMAINCVDHPEAPCPHWPVKGTRYPKKVRAEGSPPIVVVGTTRDPATPYKLAKSLAKQLANGVLLTNDADGHTAYGGSYCLDRKIDEYLISAKRPQDGACKA